MFACVLDAVKLRRRLLSVKDRCSWLFIECPLYLLYWEKGIVTLTGCQQQMQWGLASGNLWPGPWFERKRKEAKKKGSSEALLLPVTGSTTFCASLSVFSWLLSVFNFLRSSFLWGGFSWKPTKTEFLSLVLQLGTPALASNLSGVLITSKP